MSQYKFNQNNFDLIRLFAAFQVLLHHCTTHLELSPDSWLEPLLELFELFPGVPIFFFISGFLISRSYESNSSLTQYGKNRVLRLFPGLIVCGISTTLLILASGYIDFGRIESSELMIWFLTQVTIFQFYDPQFLSGYGIGKANGSLWTIYIELQFYILTPILYLFLRRIFTNARTFSAVITLLCILFLLISQFGSDMLQEQGSLLRLYTMTFLPYFYMFLIGLAFQRYFNVLIRYLEGKFLWILTIYLGGYYLSSQFSTISLGNRINPLMFLILCTLIFSAAFSYRSFSHRLLGKNDISYGLYIYHMPIVNFLMFMELTNSSAVVMVAILASFLVAITSWLVVEKPVMKFKSRPLRI